MCKPVKCPTCEKFTWTGCGQHIPYAMNQTPKEQWCTCVPISGPSSKFPPKYGEGKPVDKS